MKMKGEREVEIARDVNENPLQRAGKSEQGQKHSVSEVNQIVKQGAQKTHLRNLKALETGPT